MDLSIVIPTYNEAGNISVLIAGLRDAVAAHQLDYEIIIVDGGSADCTLEEAEKAGARAFVQSGRGYGNALKEGLAASKGEYIATMDADLSHDAVFVDQLLSYRGKADLVIASRYVKGGASDTSRFRSVLSIILNLIFGWVLDLPIKDLSSGFRMYDRRALEGIEIAATDFDVLEEILIQIYCAGGRVVEMPFHYKQRVAGKSNAKLAKFAVSYVRTLYRMWRLRRNIEKR